MRLLRGAAFKPGWALVVIGRQPLSGVQYLELINPRLSKVQDPPVD